ncbi:DNA mismatch repair protein Msh3-like [Thrips palmi]|uniref:DNA mismatch repair protein MSH3 n=1 Tax=Thrips palmi TaxID=161013 RepID=A0A6P8YVN5_THRPL|nr:DNA mismatch repair protein Msh3-like [Thrips palmi]
MSKPKPNFWRLKRKAKDKIESSVQNPPSLSQKTISSFFGSKKSSNLGVDSKDGSPDDSEEPPKRIKLDEEPTTEVVLKEKAPIKLSDCTLLKLKSFSTSPEALTDSDCNGKRTAKPRSRLIGAASSSLSSNCLEKMEEDSPDDGFKSNCGSRSLKNSEVASLAKFGKVKFTPLEQQVVDLKKEHPGVLLFVECGYKYRFFGEDAEIAAQELNIYAHLDHNFMTASIPVHRLHAHVGRLVEKGHKVGIVKQVETAALKAMSDNKSAPFTRKLQHLFTRATLIGEDVDSIDQQTLSEGISAGHIFCFYEEKIDQKVSNIVFVAVNPSTGECSYEQFQDNSTREELHKRLQIMNPAEILCPTSLSADSERLVNHSNARIERLPPDWFETTDALTRVVGYFTSKDNGKAESAALEELTELPLAVLGCLAAAQKHLNEFGLHRAIRLDGLQKLPSGEDFLYMDSSTIRNLQIFTSDSGTTHGSLFWALNHTKTKFGARLLHKWLSQPIRVKKDLEERQECIEELLSADQAHITQLKNILGCLPDIEKGLTTILHNKCSPLQFFTILDALCGMTSDFSSLLAVLDQDTTVPRLLKAIQDAISLLDGVQAYRDNMVISAAKDGDKTKLLKDFSAFPNVLKLMREIEETIQAIDALKPEIAKKLSLFSVQYSCVSGQEYLIEVKNNNSRSVPANWRKISSTKQVGRYRPPAVDKLFGDLQRLREMLRAECQLAWIGLLQDFSQQYFKHKQAVYKIATLDVILSLAHVAQQEGYCKPKLLESESSQISIKRGRHPIVPLLLTSAGQFVPNDTHLNSSGECCMVLSGPNMGGKSCYIRQVALIALLAHVGSFVPAECAEISLLDSIFTRMGARDELFNGRSTLMVELDETAAILRKVSKHSLVLLDELGRGTGSCDGSAIACATLRHIALEVQCLSLFVTHYPSVMDTANELEGKASNYHMAFVLHDQDEAEFLTFLYEVVRGAADRSYGINVARLANLDKRLLIRAASVAADLEKQARNRREIRLSFMGMWQK